MPKKFFRQNFYARFRVNRNLLSMLNNNYNKYIKISVIFHQLVNFQIVFKKAENVDNIYYVSQIFNVQEII